MTKRFFTTGLFLFLIHFLLNGQIVYVDQSNTGPNPDGTLTRPFPNIQAAIQAAQNQDTIKVAQGIYHENLHFVDNKGIILWGGYQTANFTHRNIDEFVTVIDGTSTSAVVNIEFTAGPGINRIFEINGFTIRNGQRGIACFDWGNGGIGNLKVLNNTIQQNSGLTGSNDYGGGISTNLHSEIVNNRILNNSCGKGGGLFLADHSTQNPFLIEGNLIENNGIYADHGAGAYIAGRKGIIRNNIFRQNTIHESWGWGGGLIIDGGLFDGFTDEIFVELTGNVYAFNFAPSGGAGLFVDEGANVRMKNELIYGNSTTDNYRSGAFYVDGPRSSLNARTVAENITIAGNSGAEMSYGHAVFVEGDAEVSLKNAICWENASVDNKNDFYVEAGSSLSVAYSLFQSGNLGSGNFQTSQCIHTDPLFADMDAHDFRLKSTTGRWDALSQTWLADDVHSPAIDAGDPASPFALEPLPNGERVNLGFDGNTLYASKSAVSRVQSLTAENPLIVYPNPAKDWISFEYTFEDEQPQAMLELRDTTGKAVLQMLLSEPKGTFLWEARKLQPGLYLFSLKTANSTKTGKMVIVK